MKSRTFFYLLITIMLTCSHEQVFSNDFISVINKLKTADIDRGNIYSVKDLAIIRDVCMMNLDSGTIYMCKPINGNHRLGVFKGKGTISYQPPIEVEVKQLKRMMGTEIIMDSFDKMLLLFNDSTYFDIKTFSTKVEDIELPQIVKVMLDNFLAYEITDDYSIDNINITSILLSKYPSASFYAYICTKSYGEIIFDIDPYQDEEVTLQKEYFDLIHKKSKELVNSFKRSYFLDTEKKIVNKEKVFIEKYNIKTKITGSLEVICNTEMELIRNPEYQNYEQWVPFYLSSVMKVLEVTLENGDKLDFFHSDEAMDFWIKLPKDFSLDDTLKIICKYAGKMMTRYGDYVVLQTSTGWYPKHGFRNLAYFDLTYSVPDNYEFASIGELQSKEEVDGDFITKWKVNKKVRNASFNLGPYDVKEYKPANSIPFSLYYVTSDQADNVAEDIQLSTQFFSRIIGPLDITKLFATELPSGHGEAFPGLLHLSSYAFESGDDSGVWESFVSHEVAHQWWGIAVDFESYRDQWLSEGFSEYSSLLYIQAVFGNNENFNEFLEDYADEIINIRKSFISDGVEAGPISLGYRTNTNATKNDYSLIIYKKGAWIFHMLRNLFLDLNTMNENAFLAFLREIYHDFKDKRISTELFKAKVEKYTGFDMSWFFNQWVDNHYVPLYNFAYKVNQTADGKYQVKCRVIQENVPSDFTMIVPIKIVMPDDEIIRIRTIIKGKESIFDLPVMDEEPDEIIFNDLHSVLCEVDYESWD